MGSSIKACFVLVLVSLIKCSHGYCIDEFGFSDEPLKVASFNIQRFGRGKMAKPNVALALVAILQRFDIIFIQETRDQTGASLRRLIDALGHKEWAYTASAPVGRTHYKEQYVFLYRLKKARLIDAQLFDDSRGDVFEREPYVVQFLYWSPELKSEVKVTFVGAHLTPDDVPVELEALTKVITWAKHRFGDSEGVLTMGDFNADCGYLNNAEKSSATLFNKPRVYVSLVGNEIDTTVSHGTHCAYDRIILTRQNKGKVIPTAPRAYNYEYDLKLSYEEAKDVSDHYPLEFKLV